MNIAGIELGGFDAVVAVIVGFSAILSLARGFSREIISIVALFAGLAGALFIFGRYQVEVQNFIRPQKLADATLFIGVFGLIYLIISFIMKGWAKDIQGRSIGVLDRLMGLGFGVFRGALLASLFVLVVSKSANNGEPADWMTEAKSYPVLARIAAGVEKLPFARVKEIGNEIKERGEDTADAPSPTQND